MAWDLPLELVLGLVGLGVPAVVLLAHLTGGSATPPLTEASVRDRLTTETPNTPVVTVQIGDDGVTALARTSDGRLWVAWGMESHASVRSLPADALTATDSGIRVSLGDPGWPSRHVTLSDPSHRTPWLPPPPGARHGAA